MRKSIAIIGGSIAGLSAALFFVQLKIKNLTLISLFLMRVKQI
ncbi:hypothetical protein THJ009_06420 [Campylobacter jejuni]|nr:hypothetical protein THJ009_06420 [Campylobacter jejuni]